MKCLLAFECPGDPKDIVVLLGIELADVAGNDVVLITGGTFEGEFAFNCYSSGFGIESG
jgi:hypothetical protein